MSGSRRLAAASCLALLWAVSCAVFPDDAVLPSTGGGSSGGADVSGTSAAGAGGDGEPLPTAGAGGSSSLAGEGGAAILQGGAAGGVEQLGGAAGVGGASEPACAAPKQQVVEVTADTWIEAGQPDQNHGDDASLLVSAGDSTGNAERRALLALTLPPKIAGATLLGASLVLRVESNLDATLAKRDFTVHPTNPDRAFVESRATWLQWSNGAPRRWALPGGDFLAPVGSATLPAESSDEGLTFDVTEALRDALKELPVPVSLIVLETGPAPAAPSEVAFVSSEGDASSLPKLIIDYCPP